jgi:hypothetical protein
VTFADEQAWRSVSRKCGACLALAAMPDAYRAEVIDALEGSLISTRAIFEQIVADGHDPRSRQSTWEKHRSGACDPRIRRYLLGERHGLRR